MSDVEAAKERLRLRILDSFRRGTAEHVVEAIELLIEAKIEEYNRPRKLWLNSR